MHTTSKSSYSTVPSLEPIQKPNLNEPIQKPNLNIGLAPTKSEGSAPTNNIGLAPVKKNKKKTTTKRKKTKKEKKKPKEKRLARMRYIFSFLKVRIFFKSKN